MLFPESLSNRQPANRSTSSSSGHDLHNLKEKPEIRALSWKISPIRFKIGQPNTLIQRRIVRHDNFPWF